MKLPTTVSVNLGYDPCTGKALTVKFNLDFEAGQITQEGTLPSSPFEIYGKGDRIGNNDYPNTFRVEGTFSCQWKPGELDRLLNGDDLPTPTKETEDWCDALRYFMGIDPTRK